MRDITEIREKFTHNASFCGIPCFYNVDTNLIAPKYLWMDKLLLWTSYVIKFLNEVTYPLAIIFDKEYEPTFHIKLKEEIKNEKNS